MSVRLPFVFYSLLALASVATGQPTFSPTPAIEDAAAIKATLAVAEAKHEENYRVANYADAIAAARGALALAEQKGALTDQVSFLRHLAYDNWLMGDNETALEYAQRVLEAAANLDDNRLRAQGHRHLAQIYDVLGDAPRARTHAENAFRFANLTGDEQLRTFALNSVAISQEKAGQLDAAERGFRETLAYWEKIGNRWNSSNALANVADIADLRGNLPRALEIYETILATRIELNDRRGQVRAISAIASLLRRLHRADDAVARLLATRPLAESVGGHRILAEFYGTLAQAQESGGDFAAALATERLAASEREQLASERARLRANDLEARLDLAQKQQAIEQLSRAAALREAELRTAAADLARARTLRFALIDGLLLLGVVAGAVILILRYRLAAERRIRAATAAVSPSSEI